MSTYDDILGSALSKFSKLVKKPERYIKPDSDLLEEIKLLSKVLYDVGKITEESSQQEADTLPELIIQGFDEEQVWAGIQLQNQDKIEKWRQRIGKTKLKEDCNLFLGDEKKLIFDDEIPVEEMAQVEAESDNEEDPEQDDDLDAEENDEDADDADDADADDSGEEDENEIEEDDDIYVDPDFQNMSDSEGDDLPLFDGESDEFQSDDSEIEGETYKTQEKKMMEGKKASKRSTEPTEVDDDFFKLRDMEAFLELEDKKFEGGETYDDGDDVDMFENIDDEDDKPINYKDYFNDEQNIDVWLDKRKTKGSNRNTEMVPMGNANNIPLGQRNTDDKDLAENDEDMNENGADENEEDMEVDHQLSRKKNLLDASESEGEEENEGPKSSHELAQERLQAKIINLEKNAVSDKPWQMGGEAAAPVRPENSLLAEDLDFVSGVREAPVITEAVSKNLEDIIKQRVKDQAWDDVQRKIKPIESAQEYKKKLVLDQEKSKLSLAQVYEEEYLKITQAQKKIAVPGLLDKDDGEAEPLEVKRIKESMRELFMKLDTLTHHHYTPKPKTSELKIVRNVASIAMEEVAPVGASNADLLAPEEIVDKRKGELMTDADKTQTDRKRERRSKKALAKAKVNEKAKKDKLNGGVKSLEESNKDMAKAEKDGKLKVVKEKDKNPAFKSSTAFFNVLQDEISSGVKSKTDLKHKKDKNKVSFSSLKM